MLRLKAQNAYDLLSGKYCSRRLYYKFQGVQETKPGAFEELIVKMGLKHEKEYANTFPEVYDVAFENYEQREEVTSKLLSDRYPVIYQGVLKHQLKLGGEDIELTGIPDFIIARADEYVVRDCKIARKLDKHKEIACQLMIYGLLMEEITGRAPKLEVYMGDGSIEGIEYSREKACLFLDDIREIATLEHEPYSPVGLSKCKDCVFSYLCWEKAMKENDVATIDGIDGGLAIELKSRGIVNIDQLLSNFDPLTLSLVKRNSGKIRKKVGKVAYRILVSAESRKKGENIILGKPAIPKADNYVMFDLEGIPANLDIDERIYLWGMQVYGRAPGAFMPAIAPVEEGGDRAGWESFLDIAGSILSKYGDIPFIHWASYEKTHIKKYIEKFGDRDGIAERVLENLCDLLPITRDSIIIPEPGYGLKTVEQVAGYHRTQTEFGGAWSIVQYYEAMETEDKNKRRRILDEIIKYNEEDLQATWAVFEWLRELRKD